MDAEPHLAPGLRATSYNGEPDPDILDRLHQYAEAGQLEVHVSRRFTLDEVADAHWALAENHFGKFALRVRRTA